MFYVCMLVSCQNNDYTFIVPKNTQYHIQQHNSGYLTYSTAQYIFHLLEWFVFICGFGGHINKGLRL